jgi:hypothetical protein
VQGSQNGAASRDQPAQQDPATPQQMNAQYSLCENTRGENRRSTSRLQPSRRRIMLPCQPCRKHGPGEQANLLHCISPSL